MIRFDSQFSDFEVEEERQKIEQISHDWDDPIQTDWGAEEAAAAEASLPSQQPLAQTFKCTALYSYSAQNPDELTIVESEQLEVVGEGDGDGWLRARNYRGEEGFVPHNYLDVERDTPVDTHTTAQLSTQISFSSVDYTVDTEDQDQMQDSGQSPDQISVISAPRKAHQMYCIALYDYDATAEDELTFEEGQVCYRRYMLDSYRTDNEHLGTYRTLIFCYFIFFVNVTFSLVGWFITTEL